MPRFNRIEAAFTRAALRGEETRWPDWQPDEEQRFLTSLDQQGLSGLMHEHIRSGRCAGVPARPLHALANATYTTVARNALRTANASTVLAALERASIPCAALKGLALLVDGYEHLGLRPMTDTDILVSPSQMDDAASVLAELGYHQSAIDTPGVAHHWCFTRSESPHLVDVIELHRQLFVAAPYDVAFDTDTLLARRHRISPTLTAPPGAPAAPDTAGTSDVPVLAYPDRLLHSVGHLVVQHAGAERLIWLADVDRLVKRGSQRDTFWPQVHSRARATGLEHELEQALRAASSWFATNLSASRDQRSSGGRLAAEDIRLAGSADVAISEDLVSTAPRSTPRVRSARPSGARAWSDVAASASWRRRIALARAHALPSPSDVSAWYGVRHAWQLPWYYARRWVRGVRDVLVDRLTPAPAGRTPDQWFVED